MSGEHLTPLSPKEIERMEAVEQMERVGLK